MDTFISFQPAQFCDKITEDGRKLYKTPYPLAFTLDGKIVDDTDFWQGRNDCLVGFAESLDRQTVDLYFLDLAEKFASNPLVFDKVHGMFMVIRDRKGSLGAVTNPVQSYRVFPAPQPTEPTDAPSTAPAAA